MEKIDQELENLRMKKAETLIRNQSMPQNVTEIHSSEEFNKLLKEYPDKVIIIDFSAVWCGPCQFFAPIFKKLQGEYKDHFIFLKVDVDENNAIAMKYRITGVPTTLFIKNDEVIHQIVGAMNYEGMKKVLDKIKQ